MNKDLETSFTEESISIFEKCQNSKSLFHVYIYIFFMYVKPKTSQPWELYFSMQISVSQRCVAETEVARKYCIVSDISS